MGYSLQLGLQVYFHKRVVFMRIAKIALVLLFVILGVALSAIILMQEGKSDGLGALSGSTDTYWQKNRGRSVEGSLEKFTKYGTVAFFAVALLLDIIW